MVNKFIIIFNVKYFNEIAYQKLSSYLFSSFSIIIWFLAFYIWIIFIPFHPPYAESALWEIICDALPLNNNSLQASGIVRCEQSSEQKQKQVSLTWRAFAFVSTPTQIIHLRVEISSQNNMSHIFIKRAASLSGENTTLSSATTARRHQTSLTPTQFKFINTADFSSWRERKALLSF